MDETKVVIAIEEDGFDDVTDQASELAEELGEGGIGGAADEAGKGIKDLDRSMRDFGAGLDRIIDKLDRLGDRLRRINNLGGGGPGGGLGGPGGGGGGPGGGGGGGGPGPGGGGAGGGLPLGGGFSALKGLALGVGGAAAGALFGGIAAVEENLALQRATIALQGHLSDPYRTRDAEAAEMAPGGRAWERYQERFGQRGIADLENQLMRVEMGSDKKSRMRGAHSLEFQDSILFEDPELKDAKRQRLKKTISKARAHHEVHSNPAVEDLRAELSDITGLERLTLDMLAFAGKDAIAGREFAGQFLGRGGGDVSGAYATKDLLAGAIAAQTAYGVSATASGGVLAGSRYGGMIGAEGGGDFLAQMIYEGLASGLDRSQIAGYLEEMSSNQEQWTKTGMPVDPMSFLRGVSNLTALGISSPRAMALTSGLTGQAQKISHGGVTSAEDMAVLQELGGFTGGGAQEYVAALRRLEKGGDRSRIPQLAGRYVRGAGGNREASLLAMIQGIPGIGFDEAEAFYNQEMGLPQSPAQQAAIDKYNKLKGQQNKHKDFRNVASLRDEAALQIERYAPGVQSSAELQNERIMKGERFIKIAQDLEKASLAGIGAMSEFNKMTGAATGVLSAFAQTVEHFIGWTLRSGQ